MITALGPRLGLGLRLDFGSQVWFVQYFSENLVVVLYSRFHVILQNSRFISQISFHFFLSFFNFSSHGRVDFAPECPSRQSKMIFRKIPAIRLKMVCCMPLSSHKKVPYSKERQRLHAFCHGVPRGFFRACKALDWGRNMLRRIQSLEQREGFKKIMRVQTALIDRCTRLID